MSTVQSIEVATRPNLKKTLQGDSYVKFIDNEQVDRCDSVSKCQATEISMCALIMVINYLLGDS